MWTYMRDEPKVMFFALCSGVPGSPETMVTGADGGTRAGAGDRVSEYPIIGGEVEGALVPRDPGPAQGAEPLRAVRLAISVGVTQGQDAAVVRAVLRLRESHLAAGRGSGGSSLAVCRLG